MKILLIALLSVVSVFAQIDDQKPIHYKIDLVSTVDRTNLEVSVQFKAKNNEPIPVRLPTGCYGTPSIHKYVTAFNGNNGTEVRKAEKDSIRIIKPNSKGNVSFKYVLSYDPKKLDESAFAPRINQNHVSLAGCQWLLHIGDDKKKHRFIIEFSKVPKNWFIHSSIAKNARKMDLITSYSGLLSTRIGGGGDRHSFYVKNKPVSVLLKGKFQIPKEKIFAAVEKIVRVQRDWFGDYNQPFYQVVINERSGVVAGTAVKNQFVCFVRSEVTELDLNMILAHEMFHNWLPLKMKIKRDKNDRQVRHEWFSEGFTDYFAKKVLFDSGLLSPKQFADLIKKDIYNLADNPHKNIPYINLLALAKARKFTSTHKKLSYYRGVLIALKWETQIRKLKNNKNLSDFLRGLYKYASQQGGEVTEKEFFEFTAGFGINAKSDFDEYILKGKPIKLTPKSLGNNFIGFQKNAMKFEIGFDLRNTRKTKKVSSVVYKSAAYKAGLRNGMDYIQIKNAWRFSNSWKPNQPITVTVKIDGNKKLITYFPRGKPIKLLQFQPKK